MEIRIGVAPGVLRWRPAGTLEIVPVSFSYDCEPVRITDSGDAIVYWLHPELESHRNYIWREGSGSQLLPMVGLLQPQVRAATPDASVIVGQALITLQQQSRAFRWTAQGARFIAPGSDILYGVSARISADGWRIVGTTNSTNPAFPSWYYLWDPVNGARDFRQQLVAWGLTQLQGWGYFGPDDISRDGTVVAGAGLDPQGQRRIFVAHLPPFCYANCDGSTAAPALNVLDFNCFLNRFNAALSGDGPSSIYANCNNDGGLNVLDFTCFLNKFTAGCP